ncbi:hypothetical protein BU16DRAFT_586516 [Lophium mytilinum]|uniref:Uncharacterized protein n=1 Tax=Lophium mytilinum TaxID=390894 RepID=A0A6A6QAK0_9PEZI|nr:hypothetical protein BU16DRAFT_586516 [Lophium mytilinum]
MAGGGDTEPDQEVKRNTISSSSTAKKRASSSLSSAHSPIQPTIQERVEDVNSQKDTLRERRKAIQFELLNPGQETRLDQQGRYADEASLNVRKRRKALRNESRRISETLQSLADDTFKGEDTPVKPKTGPESPAMTMASDSSDPLLALKERHEGVSKKMEALKQRQNELRAELHQIGRTKKSLEDEEEELLKLIHSQEAANQSQPVFKSTSEHAQDPRKPVTTISVANETPSDFNNSAIENSLSDAQVPSRQETPRAGTMKTHVRRDRSASPVREQVEDIEKRRRDREEPAKAANPKVERVRKPFHIRYNRSNVFLATPKAPAQIVGPWGKPDCAVPVPLQEEPSLAKWGYPTIVPYEDTWYELVCRVCKGNAIWPDDGNCDDIKVWLDGASGLQKHLRIDHDITVDSLNNIVEASCYRELTPMEVRDIKLGVKDAYKVPKLWCGEAVEEAVPTNE